jgi:hypothetical protein
VQRTLAGGLVAGLVVGVAAGATASRWFGRGEAAPAHEAGDRLRVFGEDSIEPCVTGVDVDASPWRFMSFEVPAPALRAEVRSEELAPLSRSALVEARATDLEVEVGRLSAALERMDPRRQRIARLVAANELRHGDLYREVAELVLLDPESVTGDPSDAFGLLVRLADESGLAAAPAADRQKELHPERDAPELYLSLGSGEDELAEWVRFSATLSLPKAPAEWRGSPLDLRVVLDLRRSRCGEASVLLSARGNSFENRDGLEWSASWNRDATLLQRSPWNGGKDEQKCGPSDFAGLRVAVDGLFEKLRSRAR